MKRIVTAALSTVTTLVLLFGYHTSTSGPLATSSATSVISGSSTSDSSTGDSSSFTGAVAQTRWGPVQVQITVAGSKVSDVSVIEYPSGNGKDEEINSYALPILIDETKQSQSADIDMVSGATVTSEGYLQSLQSALDEANL
ncbi:MAG: hypothetical protein JWR55_395 [Aeromicrobium sp.]|jgi:uncharacterized protein with FMN-binding domain|nr:hypothetical protein [Aeromicrobium sp.]